MRRPQFSWRSFCTISPYTVIYDLTWLNRTSFSRFKSIDTCWVINWHPYIGNGMDNKLLTEKTKQVIVWWVHQKMPIHCLNYRVAFFGRGQKPATTITVHDPFNWSASILSLLHINWFFVSSKMIHFYPERVINWIGMHIFLLFISL